MSKRKLLLADDSATIQKVVNLTFANEDIEVIAVGDGDTAMEKFNEAAPDLVMADVNMPGLDGYRICETIKQSAETKHIPVILLVGSFEPFNEAEARRVGADDFLTKPFQSIRQLVNKVSELLDGGKAADSAAEVVNSFEDTLEMEKPKAELPAAEDLGDAAMDDEMIQANQIGIQNSDEAQKFESEPMYQTSLEDIDLTSLKQPYHYESLEEFEAENDWAKTPPLSETDLDEMASVFDKTETATASENIYEFAGEEDFADAAEENAAAQNTTPQSAAAKKSSSGLNFDDLDLLEIPQSKKKSLDRSAAQNKTEQKTEEVSAEQTENLSSEMIDAIAARVGEKIFDKVVAEVVKQMEMKK